MGKYLAKWAVVLFVLTGAQWAVADTLTLKDGRVLNGRVIMRDANSITFEFHVGKVTGTRVFPADEVAALTETPYDQAKEEKANPVAPKYDGPTYMVIPVIGSIGKGLEVNLSIFDRSLARVRVEKPTVLILDIDSPGGEVDELFSILEAIGELEDIRLVAYVRKAGSAAAYLTMACPEIIMAPNGVIGAAVIFIQSPNRNPQNISAKFESFRRAQLRSVAQKAGHNPLFIEGMMRMDIQLSVIEVEGKPQVIEGLGGMPLKKVNEILTLTAGEAVSSGLAIGVADSIEEANELLGIDKWKQGSRAAIGMARLWRKKLEQAEKGFERTFKHANAELAKARQYLTKKMPSACLKRLEGVDACLRGIARLVNDNEPLVLAGRILSPSQKERLRIIQQEADQVRSSANALLPRKKAPIIVGPQNRGTRNTGTSTKRPTDGTRTKTTKRTKREQPRSFR